MVRVGYFSFCTIEYVIGSMLHRSRSPLDICMTQYLYHLYPTTGMQNEPKTSKQLSWIWAVLHVASYFNGRLGLRKTFATITGPQVFNNNNWVRKRSSYMWAFSLTLDFFVHFQTCCFFGEITIGADNLTVTTISKCTLCPGIQCNRRSPLKLENVFLPVSRKSENSKHVQICKLRLDRLITDSFRKIKLENHPQHLI